MASGKDVLIYKDGMIWVERIRKPQAPRGKFKWLGHCASRALQCRVKHYAVRMAGNWEVYGVDYPHPVKVFPNQDAAAMWLMYKGAS